MPDYTIGVAERIASLPDSTATSNSVNRNYFQETSKSVVNIVNVAIAPAAPTALDPTPTTTYATATDETIFQENNKANLTHRKLPRNNRIRLVR